MYRKYIVYTHLGNFTTVAVSERKALANVRYRLYGSGDASWEIETWKVREVAA